MWMPTHIQLTVQRARGLLTKGKHGTNDCFVVMSLGKDKFQTSVKEKAGPSVEWREECELTIPGQGNTAEVKLQVLHRNFLGVDEFLGQTSIPLADFDVYERPRSRWYKLHSKPDKKDTKERGELEVRVGFTVKAASASTTDLSHKGSLLSLPKMGSLGGSMASLGKKKKSLGKLAASVGHKVAKVGRKRGGSSRGSEAGSDAGSDLAGWDDTTSSNADPGVISEGEEDEFGFDDDHRGRRTGTPDHTRRLPKALEEETPLSSLASSVQSGLSDAPAISERTADAAAVPSPLATVQAARDQLSRSARTGSTRSGDLPPGDGLSSATGDGNSRSSGRYKAPPPAGADSGVTAPPAEVAKPPSEVANLPAHVLKPIAEVKRPASEIMSHTPEANVSKVEIGQEARAPQALQPMPRSSESSGYNEDKNPFGEVDESPSKPEPSYSPPRKPQSARMKVRAREDVSPAVSKPIEETDTSDSKSPKRGPPKEDVKRQAIPREENNPFEMETPLPPKPTKSISDKTVKKPKAEVEEARPSEPKSSPFELVAPKAESPSKRRAPKAPERADAPSLRDAAVDSDGTGNPFEEEPEKVVPKPAKRSLPVKDSTKPAHQTGANPVEKRDKNPFEEEGPNPFDDDSMNPFANEEEEGSVTDQMRRSFSSPQDLKTAAEDSPRREKDRSKKRDKLEKMMKKTPQILRNLTSKKDDEPQRSPEKANRQGGMTPSPSLSLLPLSDSPGSRRVVEGGNEASRPEGSARSGSTLPRETVRQYDGTSREKLIELVVDLQQQMSRSREELKRSRAQTKDLEEYVDTLLLRVMDTHPELLQSNGGPVRPGAKYVGRGG